MKFLKINNPLLLAFMVVIMFSSCEKTFDEKLVTDQDLGNSSTVQVYNAIVNSARNYVYVDGNTVTGALLTPGSTFPVSGTGIGFQLPGGLHNFTVRDTLRTSTQVAINFAENLQADRHYT